MKNLKSKLIGAGVGLGCFIGSLVTPNAIYSQNVSANKQDTAIQQNQPAPQYLEKNKKEKKYYSDASFQIGVNLDKNVNDLVGTLYGFKINGGRRLSEEVRLGLVLDYLGKSKKHDDEKDKQNYIGAGLGVFWAPWASTNKNGTVSDGLSIGGGFKLNLNEFEFEDNKNKETDKIDLFNLGLFVRIGGQIKFKKNAEGGIILGIQYDYSKTTYQGDPLDLSTFGGFVGINLN